MKKFIELLFLSLTALALAGCGGGSGNGDFVNDGSGGTTPTTQTLGSLTASSDVSSINADGSESAAITVVARDTTGAVMSGVTVAFSSDSGSISPASVTTDANGNATATLTTGGDASARTITVSASSGGITGSASVDVIPTVATLTLITNATSIASDGSESASITAIAQDANNAVIEGVTVSFSVSSGEVSPATAVTDATGRATATLTTATDSSVRDIVVTGTVQSGLANTVTVSVVQTGSVDPAVLDLLTDPPIIGTEGTQTSTITAIVKDATNNFIEGAVVTFVADSGGLQIINATTDATGVARAQLSAAGDQANRVINVTARTGSISNVIQVNVTGTEINISGPTNISTSDTATVTVSLTDSADNGIAGQTLTISSANGNTLSTTSVITDVNGRGTFTVTGDAPGVDTITAIGFGVSSTAEINVSGDEFTFISPAAGTETVLGGTLTVTTQLLRDAVPVAGETITFSTTRGTFVGSNTAVTDANGNASVSLTANNAGPAVVIAVNEQGVSTQLDVEFVAINPVEIVAQADPFNVAANQQASVFAIVRDADQNLVKNTTVIFTIDDISGGTLSAGSAVTDSQGRAEIFYTASETPSATDGVAITATISGTAISDTVFLTATGKELFIALGTGNIVENFSTTQYAKEYAIQVTDSTGGGVAGASVSVKVISESYHKGDLELVARGAGFFWVPDYTVFGCANEDIDSDGILDAGEDLNNNQALDPGNIAAVTPGQVTTDSSGFGYVRVVYPKEYANWLDVKLEVQTSVSGTEITESRVFTLPGLDDDYDSASDIPPGPVSPFGISTSCFDTN